MEEGQREMCRWPLFLPADYPKTRNMYAAIRTPAVAHLSEVLVSFFSENTMTTPESNDAVRQR